MATRSILTVMARYFLLFLILLVNLCMSVKAFETSKVLSLMEAYWSSALPNTSMPNAIQDLIHPEKGDQLIWEEYAVVWNETRVSIEVLKLFFQPKDIHPGAKIKNAIDLSRSVVGNAFIPRREAEAIPFSSRNLTQILNNYSIIPGTKEAKQIENSIHDCETPAPKGSTKFCATSLESMVDNVISELGTHNIQIMSTILAGNKLEAKKEKVFYKVGSPVKELSEKKLVLCHPLPTPHAVFYCHTAAAFKGYTIPLEGNNGTKVNALAVCHYDTENFNALFFKMLNVAPDTKPICHFLMEDHLIWAPRA